MAVSDQPAVRQGGIGDPGPLAAQEAANPWGVGRIATLNGRLPGDDGVLPPPQREVVAERIGDDAWS